MKRICKLIGAQCSELGKSQRFLTLLLLGAAIACYYSSQYLRFANTVAQAIHPAESYIVIGSTRVNFTCVVLFAIMLLTFDAPYFSDRSLYEIARTGKGDWLISKLLFVVLEVLLYNLYILAVTMVLSLISAKSIVWSDWSPAMKFLTGAGQGSALSMFSLFFPYADFLAALSPWWAVGLTWLLNCAYCLVLVLIMTACNILLGGTKGWTIAAGIHILSYVVSNNGHDVIFAFSFSLLDCAFPAQQLSAGSSSSVVQSMLAFAAVLLVLLLPFKLLKKRLVL